MPGPVEATSSTLDVAHEESVYNKYVQASIFDQHKKLFQNPKSL